MRVQPCDGLSLFGPAGDRKYLNVAERGRFVKATLRSPLKVRLFCPTLRWSGARVCKVLALTASRSARTPPPGMESHERLAT